MVLFWQGTSPNRSTKFTAELPHTTDVRPVASHAAREVCVDFLTPYYGSDTASCFQDAYSRAFRRT
jgi:hypothetical protein